LHLAQQERLILGARHLLSVPAAHPLLELVVAATLEAVEAYRGPEETPQVRYDNPRFYDFDADTVMLTPALLSTDHPDAFSGGDPSETWIQFVDLALVTRFVGIVSPEDYVERQLGVIKEWADAHDASLGSPIKTGPATGFVVMPFGEPWSDEVSAFINRAVGRLEGRLTAVRADQITRLGRITDQIMKAIQNADVIIADITGRNANVFWELGYAYAFGKPCALLMRDGDTAPFDIYDHRRIDYHSPPTKEDEISLGEILSQTLDPDPEA
jgi:hypothetical protein